MFVCFLVIIARRVIATAGLSRLTLIIYSFAYIIFVCFFMFAYFTIAIRSVT